MLLLLFNLYVICRNMKNIRIYSSVCTGQYQDLEIFVGYKITTDVKSDNAHKIEHNVNTLNNGKQFVRYCTTILQVGEVCYRLWWILHCKPLPYLCNYWYQVIIIGSKVWRYMCDSSNQVSTMTQNNLGIFFLMLAQSTLGLEDG